MKDLQAVSYKACLALRRLSTRKHVNCCFQVSDVHNEAAFVCLEGERSHQYVLHCLSRASLKKYCSRAQKKGRKWGMQELLLVA